MGMSPSTENDAAAPHAPQKYLGDVSEVRSNVRFDEQRLDSWLRSALADSYSGPLRVRQFDGG